VNAFTASKPANKHRISYSQVACEVTIVVQKQQAR
jgi:hypothetical protein